MNASPGNQPPFDAAETVISNRAPAVASASAPASASGVSVPGLQLRPAGTILRFELQNAGETNARQTLGFVGGILALVGIYITCMILKLPPGPVSIAFMVVLLSAIFGFIFSMQKRCLQRARPLIKRINRENLQDLVPQVVKASSGFGYQNCLKELLHSLIQHGMIGTTIHLAIAGKQPESNLAPLEQPFEPQLLNETASEMIRATAAAEGRRVAGQLGRNLALKGGLVALLAIVPQFLIAAIDAVERRRITTRLAFLGLAVILAIVIPVGFRPLSPRQWLVVPGGLLLRRAKGGSEKWNVQMFDRERSVLLVMSTRHKNARMLLTAGSTVEQMLLTRLEAEFLLRAWISPVKPPADELLRELE